MESLDINERGYFWWSDQQVPEENFAAAGGSFGTLKIDIKGRTVLELESPLSQNRFGVFEQGKQIARNICGLLSADSRQVLLCELRMNGGRFNTVGFSNEQYTAKFCVIGSTGLFNLSEIKSIAKMEVNLSGFEEWLRQGSISIRSTKRTTTIKHKFRKNVVFDLIAGKIEFRFDVLRQGYSTRHADEATLKETMHIVYTKTFHSLDAVVAEYQSLEDFFLVLIDRERSFGWPKIYLKKNRRLRLFIFNAYRSFLMKLRSHAAG